MSTASPASALASLSLTLSSITSTATTNPLSWSGDGHYFEDSITPTTVRGYLDSKHAAENSKGIKWLLAMMSKGRDVASFFAQVVKNVSTNNLENKKLVYMYLVHYADWNADCRELALLSINSFQKDLSTGNQLIRALALRVLSSIRVKDIAQIQLLAVKKASQDSSPYVRKVRSPVTPTLASPSSPPLCSNSVCV